MMSFIDALTFCLRGSFGGADLRCGNRTAWQTKGAFDFDAAEKNNPKNVGCFQIEGDCVEIYWGGEQGAANWELEHKDGKISAIDSGGIVVAPP